MQTMNYEEIIRREVAAGMNFGPFARAKAINDGAPPSVLKHLEMANRMPEIVGDLQRFTGSTDSQVASSTAVASTNSETNLFNANTNPPIPANSLRAGQVLTLRCGGVISNTGTPTVIFTPRIGNSATPASNVSLGASATVTTAASLSSSPWYAEFTLAIRSTSESASGCTGTGNGFVSIGGPASTAATVLTLGGTVATTIDNTIALSLILSLTWSANSASNTCTCQWRQLATAN